MKKYRKFVIVVVYIIQATVIFYLGYSIGKIGGNFWEKNSTLGESTIHETEGNNMKTSIYVSGMLASYEYIEREVNLEYFYKLNNTSTYGQIIEDIGEPNGQYGSGIQYVYYEIGDDLYVSLSFNSYDKLGLMYLCTQKEILGIICPKDTLDQQ